ncbi:MAG: hypothetical protein KA516_09365 [Providencia sp.]|nr:hypothetical protein [Providencia sp.]
MLKVIRLIFKRWITWIIMMLILLVSVMSYFLAGNITYNNVTNIMSVLQNVSSIIFAIVGVWVGYLYPKLITEIINNRENDFFDSKTETKKMESLITTIALSAIVLIGVLVFYLLVLFIKGSDFYLDNLNFFKMLGVTYAFILVCIQIYCIFSVILSNVSFVNKLYKLLNDKKMDSRL